LIKIAPRRLGRRTATIGSPSRDTGTTSVLNSACVPPGTWKVTCPADSPALDHRRRNPFCHPTTPPGVTENADVCGWSHGAAKLKAMELNHQAADQRPARFGAKDLGELKHHRPACPRTRSRQVNLDAVLCLR